ncbi:MAG: heparan-alpha-glucosaminide N-acetyltransferase [Betaproteobacteria bacterium]
MIDTLRGVAIVMMLAYHFSFDLNYFGVFHQNFYQDGFWIAARSVIVGSFLALVGVSLALAAGPGIQWPAYGRRLAVIAACASMVSAGSYFMFPASWIFFGVLHFIVVAGLLGPAFVRLHRANLVIGVALIAAGALFAAPLFDRPWLNWIGLMTRKPVTEDYVPLLPWFGVVLVGMFIGRQLVQARARGWHAAGTIGRSLEWAGRHSLAIYVLHQPLLLGILYLLLGHRR